MATPNSNDVSKSGNEIEKIIVEILRTVHEYLKKQSEVERIHKGEQSFTANDFLILEELRLEYDREMKTRKNIEAKAGSLITVSGAIITLLFGFTTFFFSTVRNNVSIYPYLLVTDPIIIASAASITLAIFFSSLALRLGRNLSIVSLINRFVLQDGNISLTEINNYRALPSPAIIQNYITTYIDSIKTNIEFVNKKAKLIGIAQTCFIIGIILIGITLALSYLRL